MSGLFDDLMLKRGRNNSLFDALVGTSGPTAVPVVAGAPNCDTQCPSSMPEDPPDPYLTDGVLHVYCWALVHGPSLPTPESVSPPGAGNKKWTHADPKHWCNGVTWVRQALRCPTRPRLETEVAKHLTETIAKVHAAPKGSKRRILNDEYERYGRRITDPPPLAQAEKLQRIARHKLNAPQRNEALWPTQQAFWEGAAAAVAAYKVAWQNTGSPGDDRALSSAMEDALHNELYLGAKRLEQ